ncbi:Angiotensin-converting enzyme [Armadillidium nasatum]|uniref:Angiotensin-converting enzyme n=1 Tax=Armadillidium nasatum TaxID=96803 RepID=A0A5N5SLM4_9CRUS|nr:Angiotensin-converting enzyme [Armadillidium nasatum]
MGKTRLLVLLLCLCFCTVLNEAIQQLSSGTTEGVAKAGNSSQNLTEEEAQLFLQKIDEEGARRANIYNHLSWSFQTNITDYNREKLLSSITSNMGETYSKGKICDFFNSSKCDLSLEPEIEHIMKTSRNYDELKYVWKTWRDKVGRPVRCQFSEMVELLNEAAAYNGFETAADYWLFDYESKSFENDVERIAKQLHPLYEQLHAYTRRKLREIYGEDKISKTGPIPAHVTGNMWAQSWINIYDILVPYPNKTSIDVSETMVNQGYTPKIMFKKADDFFASLGLERVPDSFWNNSLLEKPSGRDLVCHANAWDFSDGKDFRIKQCTRVNQNDFSTVHHELGHVQYYLQYKHLPHIFRRGANPGFHEAIGDVLDLSVSTPKHLHKVGLLETYDIDDEADINFLLKTATRKVAFLPYGYLIDKYRWNILRGLITPQNYTKAWWKYRYEYQGIEPPVERTELDFDPAAKKHVSGNIRYIRYFAAHILQFQFHKALCLLAKEYDANDPNKPLHRCDIYQSKEAGKALKEMMSLGRSKHWKEALKLLTGTDQLDASALREYFLPLENWLKANNEEHGEIAGWDGYETWLQKNKNLKNETQNLGDAQILPKDQLQNPSKDSEGKTNRGFPSPLQEPN